MKPKYVYVASSWRNEISQSSVRRCALQTSTTTTSSPGPAVSSLV